LGVLGVIIILLGITIAYFTSKSITSRVRKIRRSLKKLSFGIYSQEELPKFNDEKECKEWWKNHKGYV
jgi:sensor histidine kinase YesM